MKTVSVADVADVEAHFSTYLEQSQTEGPIIITHNGKAVAVLLTPQDDDDLERLVLGRSPHFQALLEQSRKSIQSGDGLSRDAFWEAVERRYHEKQQENKIED